MVEASSLPTGAWPGCNALSMEHAVPDQNGLVRVAKSRLADLNEERELLTHVVEFYETRGSFERLAEHDREMHHHLHQEFNQQEGQQPT